MTGLDFHSSMLWTHVPYMLVAVVVALTVRRVRRVAEKLADGLEARRQAEKR